MSTLAFTQIYFCKGPFIYYVIKFLGFLDPPLPLRQHVFSTKNKQKLAFSDPPSPSTSADVIYEWSLRESWNASAIILVFQPITK